MNVPRIFTISITILLVTLGVCGWAVVPKYGGFGGISIGPVYTDLSSLNSILKDYGYKEFGNIFVTVGGEGFGKIDRIILGGKGFGNINNMYSDNGNNVIMLNIGGGFFNVGYSVFEWDGGFTGIVIGIGGYGLNMTISSSSLTNNSFKGILINPAYQTVIYTGGFALSLEWKTLLVVYEFVGIELNIGGIYSPSTGWFAGGITGPSVLRDAPQVFPVSAYASITISFGKFSEKKMNKMFKNMMERMEKSEEPENTQETKQ